MKYHPLPVVIAAVSAAACAAAVWAGMAGMSHPRSRSLAQPAAAPGPAPQGATPQEVTPQGPAVKAMIGVAGQSGVAWEKTTGIQPSLAVSYISMAKPVPERLMYWAETDADGARPMIEILPRGQSLQSVADGQADSWLRALRSEITEPVVVAFAPEANGNWYSWGRQPVLFRRAWRHVWSVFGTHDITWLWQMSARPNFLAYWPGNKYVTWAGIDGYFITPSSSFNSVFGTPLHWIRSSCKVPVLLSETAVGPETGRVRADIQQLFAGAKRARVIGVVWFDHAQHGGVHHQDWSLTASPGALEVFRRAARLYQQGLTA